MLVSVIVTNYNYGRFLGHAIDSALNQTYPNIEVIVIDDGSTDRSADIIKSYGDRIIPVLKSNSGHCSCINLGYAKSRGDVVIFLDADDALFADAVEQHVARLRDPAVVKSCGYLQVIDAEGAPTGGTIPPLLSPSGDYRERTLREGIGVYRSSYTSGNAWSRRFLEKVMPLPASESINNKVGPDGYLTSVDVLFGRVESIAHAIGQYRVHGSNNGPVSFRFDATYFRTRVQCRIHRIRYAERVAHDLGLQVNVNEFHRFNEWRLSLMHHALALMEGQKAPAPLFDFITAPFRQHQQTFRKPATIALLFALIRILPRAPALRVARHLLVERES